jgi:hypothetical protein
VGLELQIRPPIGVNETNTGRPNLSHDHARILKLRDRRHSIIIRLGVQMR